MMVTRGKFFFSLSVRVDRGVGLGRSVTFLFSVIAAVEVAIGVAVKLCESWVDSLGIRVVLFFFLLAFVTFFARMVLLGLDGGLGMAIWGVVSAVGTDKASSSAMARLAPPMTNKIKNNRRFEQLKNKSSWSIIVFLPRHLHRY